jgi:hypothetical protein
VVNFAPVNPSRYATSSKDAIEDLLPDDGYVMLNMEEHEPSFKMPWEQKNADNDESGVKEDESLDEEKKKRFRRQKSRDSQKLLVSLSFFLIYKKS